MDRPFSNLFNLNTLLWIIAGIVALLAGVAFVPNLFNMSSTASTPPAVAVGTRTPTRIATPTSTPSPLPVEPKPQDLVSLGTPPPDAELFNFVADPTRSGSATADRSLPNWGDSNLHVGFVKGQVFQSLLYFDLSSLPPGTKVLAADLELTGLSRDFVGSRGRWQLDMLKADLIPNWLDHSSSDFYRAPSAAAIGEKLTPINLVADKVNQFAFSDEQLRLLEQAVDSSGYLGFRLTGPSGPDDSLFTWDGGSDADLSRHPVLRLIAIPSKFIVVPNEQTPENVMTAAAQRLTATAFATRYGTPTPYARNYATATPIVVVTAQPTPANEETATAEAVYATAVAVTTGTFTPTPSNWVTATPGPEPVTPYPTSTATGIALENLTPMWTATPQPGLAQLLQTPVPDLWKGNILFLSNRFVATTLLAMSPAGQLLPTQPSGMDAYTLAFAREALSPDHTKRALVAPDPSGVLQIWIADSNNTIQAQVTRLARGAGFVPEAYDPVWSPDGTRIAYVSTETHFAEIYVYDLGRQVSTQLTHDHEEGIFNQRPSWSPDGSKLVFKSNRGAGNFQVWIMNADGSNPRNLSQSEYDDTDPIWVK